jgi:hypothetical protein
MRYSVEWRELSLRGTKQIPRVCPNCMGVGEVPVRVCTWNGYDGYCVTFYYCVACAPQAKAEQRYVDRECSGLRLIRVGSVLGWLIATPLAVGAFVFQDRIRKAGNGTAANLTMASGVLILMAGAGLGILAAKKWSRSRFRKAQKIYPRREGQITWGTAARCWEGRYTALRLEWLRLLAEANCEMLEPGEFERVFGSSASQSG